MLVLEGGYREAKVNLFAYYITLNLIHVACTAWRQAVSPLSIRHIFVTYYFTHVLLYHPKFI